MGTESNSVCFKCYVPQRPLSDFVGLFWYWRGHEMAYARERALPGGTVELVVKLDSLRSREGGISGPQSQFFVIERRMEDELLGIHFKEGGAFPFFPFPIAELHNLGTVLSDVWGNGKANELIDRVHEASTIEEKFHVLEEWLMLSGHSSSIKEPFG